MRNLVAFYSWQSDLNSKENKNLISDAIINSIKKINQSSKEDQIECIISIDRDTLNTTGTPNVAHTIFDKINKSDIFICDVSIVNNINGQGNARLMPNPNVLIELGYAIHALGWDRIICINNLKYGKIESLPFDIRAHRISVYNSNDEHAKKTLSDLLKKAISSIVTQYDDILAKRVMTINHDKEIFHKMTQIFSQPLLYNTIDTAVDELYTTSYNYNLWTSIDRFYEQSLNKFLDEGIDKLCEEFIRNLTKLHRRCAILFFPQDNKGSIKFKEGMNEEEIREYEISQVYIARKSPIGKENWKDADSRIYREQEELSALANNVKHAYHSFVTEVKKKLYS